MSYAHLIQRVLGNPLLISRAKLRTILAVLRPSFEKSLGTTIEIEAACPDEDFDDRGRNGLQVVDGIAVIDVFGTLVQRTSGFDGASGLLSYEKIRGELQTALEDTAVEKILMVFDSPGGEVAGSFELSDFIFASRELKPIFGIASEQACSAAYLQLSACTRAFATQSAIVGSIGVVVAHVDETARNEAEGIKITEIFRGERKMDCSPNRPLDDEALASIQSTVDSFFSLFVSKVARNRAIRESEVEATQARIFIGAEAQRLGLIDDIRGLPQALGEIAGRTPNDFSIQEGMIMGLKAKATDPAAQGDEDENKADESAEAGEAGSASQQESASPANFCPTCGAAKAQGEEGEEEEDKEEDTEEMSASAVANERARVQAIQGSMLPGFEALAMKAIGDGISELQFLRAQAKLQVPTAARKYLDGMRSDDTEGLPAGPPMIEWPGKPSAGSAATKNLPHEKRAKLEWDNDPKIRAEFGEDDIGLERYTAYLKNEERISTTERKEG